MSNSIHCTVHRVRNIIYCTVHRVGNSIHCTVYRVRNIIHCTVYRVRNSIQYTLYSIHYTVYIISIQYTVYIIQYTVYSLHYTVYSLQQTKKWKGIKCVNVNKTYVEGWLYTKRIENERYTFPYIPTGIKTLLGLTKWWIDQHWRERNKSGWFLLCCDDLRSILVAECFDLRDGYWTVCYIMNFELDNGIVRRNL